MSKVGDSFSRRVGHIAGNWAGYSIFGDKGADARRHIIQDARADAIRERESQIARAKDRADLNAIDAAVLRNVDAVIDGEFSDNPQELVKHLMTLIVQVKTNSFKARSDEEKIRTKYTMAVLAKLQQGLTLLEYLDPMNSRLDFITWQYLCAKWRKIFSIRRGSFSEDGQKFLLGFGMLVFVIIFGFICALAEKGKFDKDMIMPTIVLAIGAVLLLFAIKYSILGICLWFHKLKRKRIYKQMVLAAGMDAPARENTKQEPSHEEAKPVVETKEAPIVEAEKEVVEKTYMESAYDLLWNKFGSSNPILSRGYKIANNDEQKDILILGFNPRMIGNSNSIVYRFPDVEHPYPYLVKQMLVSPENDLMGRSTYLDMFGFKEPNHDVAMQNIICNPKVFGYVAAQVALTQDIIEDVIRPKLIIVLDQDLWAFFGKVKGLTWMGYSFKSLGDINGYELCEITGFTKAKDRISQDSRLASSLVGTKILFTDGQHVSKFPKPEEILEYIS